MVALLVVIQQVEAVRSVRMAISLCKCINQQLHHATVLDNALEPLSERQD